MLNQEELITLKKGDPVNHFLLLRNMEKKLKKDGSEFLSLELSDKSIALNANLWDNFEQFYNQAETGNVVKVEGVIEEFRGTPQIRITNNKIRTAAEKDNVNPEDFIAKSKRDLSEMQKEFKDRIEKISDEQLKTLINLIFDDESFEQFSKAPAGKSWHHAYISGLIEHTLELIKICDLMCDIHPEINRDLVISGAILHDYGKIEELSFDTSFEYTDKGKLVGHIVIAAMKIEETSKQIPDFPEHLKNTLMHIVLSHQGKLEHASPVVPKTLEAITLYHADELSAKVNAYKNAIATGTTDETKWTKFIQLAATDLFNHGIIYEEKEDLSNTLFD